MIILQKQVSFCFAMRVMLLLWRLRVFSLRDRSGALVADAIGAEIEVGQHPAALTLVQ